MIVTHEGFLTIFELGNSWWVYAGSASLEGSESNDTLQANATVHHLSGLAGNDSLTGTDSVNFLDGGTGRDTLTGGPGDDIYLVDNPGDVVMERADEGFDSVQASLSYALGANLERLVFAGSRPLSGTGNALNNSIGGNDAANVLDGGAGNDFLSGMGGNDTIVGGAGGDVLAGGMGVDSLIGGLGNDTYSVDRGIDKVRERAGEGVDLVKASLSWTLDANVENLALTGAARSKGVGNTLDNILLGNAARNALFGGNGDDTLLGTAGNGRGETDWLAGGSGDDLFVLGVKGHRLYDNLNAGASGRGDYAVIADFKPGHDRLQLAGGASQYYLGAPHGENRGLFFETGAADELIAILQNPNPKALTDANVIGTAVFV
ncbi:MAG TPA: calcium-binding protein [Chthoniobacterales bacterium]